MQVDLKDKFRNLGKRHHESSWGLVALCFCSALEIFYVDGSGMQKKAYVRCMETFGFRAKDIVDLLSALFLRRRLDVQAEVQRLAALPAYRT